MTDRTLLSTKELAAAMNLSRRFVTYMKFRGFQMPGGRATVVEARAWLVRNPAPCSRKSFSSVAEGMKIKSVVWSVSDNPGVPEEGD